MCNKLWVWHKFCAGFESGSQVICTGMHGALVYDNNGNPAAAAAATAGHRERERTSLRFMRNGTPIV